MIVNDPKTVATIAALHEAYENALVSNDVERLIGFFWNSPEALRFGVSESLYGAKEIEQFRRDRPATDLQRETSHVRIVTFGDDTAIATLEFLRKPQGVLRHGRQSQVWRRFGSEWKIVSAHVSFVPLSYLEQASALVGLMVPAEYQEGVRTNIDRAAHIALLLLDYPLEETDDAAPVFQP